MRRKSASAEPWTGFQFLNFSHPEEAKDQRTRKAVRSHVTRKQHHKERHDHGTAITATALARRTHSMPQLHAVQNPWLPYMERTASSPYNMPKPMVTTKGGVLPISAQSEDMSSSYTKPASPVSPTSSFVTRSPSPLVGKLDPRQLYPASWQPHITIALDTYLYSITSDILNTQDAATLDLLRTRWMPFIMTDAALLHATLLVAASLYESRPNHRTHTIDLLQLKGMTIRAINDSLEDPIKSGSDQLIAAILAMVHFEAFWGEDQAEAYKFHMLGLVHLVRIRGGLAQLGLDGLLTRIILSVDYHAARKNGSEPFFARESSPTHHKPSTF
ncbi:hypothetical protein AAFC00_004917 [Neodothiora populina]|uniref:Uncharacterized protein n=1 Tax=Neodothiora populina TaxID=2781224 RepID=A0ABR3P3M6_9PEZI